MPPFSRPPSSPDARSLCAYAFLARSSFLFFFSLKPFPPAPDIRPPVRRLPSLVRRADVFASRGGTPEPSSVSVVCAYYFAPLLPPQPSKATPTPARAPATHLPRRDVSSSFACVFLSTRPPLLHHPPSPSPPIIVRPHRLPLPTLPPARIARPLLFPLLSLRGDRSDATPRARPKPRQRSSRHLRLPNTLRRSSPPVQRTPPDAERSPPLGDALRFAPMFRLRRPEEIRSDAGKRVEGDANVTTAAKPCVDAATAAQPCEGAAEPHQTALPSCGQRAPCRTRKRRASGLPSSVRPHPGTLFPSGRSEGPNSAFGRAPRWSLCAGF